MIVAIRDILIKGKSLTRGKRKWQTPRRNQLKRKLLKR
ncbi:hypothetical protein BMETH_1570_0 [methanotrophic bacterial endosymbiont of Bathymodiolus sp.]|nr:hypothetical protein BMETH_1570_0 [methanotrophic bacterial endosymbiont of Bathymodiolus sp.]